PLAVAQSLVTADLHLALDVLAHLAAQVTFDLQVLVDVRAQPRDFLFSEVTHARVRRDGRRFGHLLRGVAADAVDVGERDLEPLLAGDVDAGDTSHEPSPLTLALLVTRVVADDAHRTMPADHLALVAHLFHGRSDLHDPFLHRRASAARLT